MNYADIKRNDAANGPGVRISLFVSGCTHHCKGCFNEEAWDFNYGKPYTEKETDYIISELAPGYIGGLTYLSVLMYLLLSSHSINRRGNCGCSDFLSLRRNYITSHH